jgi:hypothetical protein
VTSATPPATARRAPAAYAVQVRRLVNAASRASSWAEAAELLDQAANLARAAAALGAAREALRRAVLARARADGLVVHRPVLAPGEDGGPRGLPAPSDDDDGPQGGRGGEPMVGPMSVVRTFKERRQRRRRAVRTAAGDGEVVEPTEVLPPKRTGHGAVEDAATAAEDREARIHWSDDPNVWKRHS